MFSDSYDIWYIEDNDIYRSTVDILKDETVGIQRNLTQGWCTI